MTWIISNIPDYTGYDRNPPITYYETPRKLIYEERFDGFKEYKEKIETVGESYFHLLAKQI